MNTTSTPAWQPDTWRAHPARQLPAYPAKALTNPVFAVKVVCLIAAGLLMREIARRLFPLALRGEALPEWSRMLGAVTLALWIAAVTAGKFLPYTHHMLLAS